VVTHPGWRTHLRGLRDQLRSRRDLLATALREHTPSAHLEHLPPGGLNLWVRLPDGTDLDALALECGRAGLAIAVGTEWFPAEAPAPYVRLSYSGPHPAAYGDAAKILQRSLDVVGVR
jgi:DNA-binding transcriptional MocR family regulator